MLALRCMCSDCLKRKCKVNYTLELVRACVYYSCSILAMLTDNLNVEELI